jgi:hypothetical protein
MPIIFYVFISLILVTVARRTTISTFQATDKDKIGVKSNEYSGTIFKSLYRQKNLFISDTANLKSFTHIENQVKSAEAILTSQIQKINNPRLNQRKDQYLDKNLNSYIRQYAGFIDKKIDSIIHINFYWNKNTFLDFYL